MLEIDEILFSHARIQHKIKTDLAAKTSLMAKKFRNPLFICVMDGAIHFFSDLTRYLSIPAEYGFLRAKSYEGSESAGNVEITCMENISVFGRVVFLVEDIIDTGRTIVKVREKLFDLGADIVYIISLLSKPSRRLLEFKDIRIDVLGWEIPDKFVIGYGLDYNNKFRNLPYIASLKEIS